MDVTRAILRHALQSAAPNWMSFETARRRYTSNRTRLPTSSSPVGAVLASILSTLCWLITWWLERKWRNAGRLISATPCTTLAQLRVALREPTAAPEAEVPSAFEDVAPSAPPTVQHPEHVGINENRKLDSFLTSVSTITGQIVWGPKNIKACSLVSEIQSQVADVMQEPLFAVRLIHQTTVLNPLRSFAELGIYPIGEGGTVQLGLVICKDREAIAEALFARASGTIYVPPGAFVLAPFTGAHVAFWESQVVRLYDEWVTQTSRQRVKAGRAAGTNSDDDPGSDSEYEETDTSHWETREHVLQHNSAVAPQIFVDDGSGCRALIAPGNVRAWARDNSIETYSQTRGQGLAAGAVLQAALMNERERGERDEERCILIGERVEIVGEARIKDGHLVMQEPEIRSAQLHRVNSTMMGDSTLQVQNRVIINQVVPQVHLERNFLLMSSGASAHLSSCRSGALYGIVSASG